MNCKCLKLPEGVGNPLATKKTIKFFMIIHADGNSASLEFEGLRIAASTRKLKKKSIIMALWCIRRKGTIRTVMLFQSAQSLYKKIKPCYSQMDANVCDCWHNSDVM